MRSNFVDYGFPADPDEATISLDEVKQYNKHRNFGPRKKICYAPFNNMHFTVGGRVAACSFNIDYYIGNIEENTIREIWFGEQADAFRNDLANYNFSKCINCQSVLETENYSAFPPVKYDLHSSNQSEYPTQMSFEMSNLCNLECVMCSGEFSSLIRSKREKLPPLKYKYPADFKDQLQEFIPHLKIATFIGGEPVLIKEYYEMWEDIVRINPDCNIHIQTNATVLPDKFLDMIETGNFDIGISIDAVSKDLYESIRLNADFEKVQQNIDLLVKLQDKGQVHLNFNFCPLILNWQELPAMVQYANDRNVSLKILNVDYPTHLALRYRDSNYLQKVFDFLEENQLPPVSGNFKWGNNARAYQQMIDQVGHMVSRAKAREKNLEGLRDLPDETIISDFSEEFLINPIFDVLPETMKQDLSDLCSEYMNVSKFKSTDSHRKCLSNLIVHLRAVDGEVNSQRNLQQCFDAFKQVADGYIKMADDRPVITTV